jgi:hypothetical protein
VLALGSELVYADLARLVPVDPESWRDGDAPGWAWWSALIAAGARTAGIEHPVCHARIDPEEGVREPAAQVASASRAAWAPVSSRPAPVQGRAERRRIAGRGRRRR